MQQQQKLKVYTYPIIPCDIMRTLSCSEMEMGCLYPLGHTGKYERCKVIMENEKFKKAFRVIRKYRIMYRAYLEI